MKLHEINKLVNESKFASLGFLDDQGNPSIRKVFCTWHKGLGIHLISTNTSSMHVQSLLKNDRACLYFSNCQTFEGVCFTGRVKIHFDHDHKSLIWHESDIQYYPNGVDDEDYCVIEFIANYGRYYRYDGKGDISQDELSIHDKDSKLICF